MRNIRSHVASTRRCTPSPRHPRVIVTPPETLLDAHAHAASQPDSSRARALLPPCAKVASGSLRLRPSPRPSASTYSPARPAPARHQFQHPVRRPSPLSHHRHGGHHATAIHYMPLYAWRDGLLQTPRPWPIRRRATDQQRVASSPVLAPVVRRTALTRSSSLTRLSMLYEHRCRPPATACAKRVFHRHCQRDLHNLSVYCFQLHRPRPTDSYEPNRSPFTGHGPLPCPVLSCPVLRGRPCACSARRNPLKLLVASARGRKRRRRLFGEAGVLKV